MYRKSSRAQQLLHAAAMLAIGASAAHAGDVVWTGAVSSNWNDPGNWSTNAVPTSADTVYLKTNVTNLPTSMNLSTPNVGTVIFVGTSDLTVSGSELTLNRLMARHNRNVTYATGSTQVTVIGGSGTTGLQPGMTFNSGADGIPAGTTIVSIDSPTTFTISAAPTGGATNASRIFDAGANVVWNGDLVANSSTQGFNAAANRMVTFNGNISGTLANGLSPSGNNINGTIELKGTNTYGGRTYANTGVIRFYGQNAVSPNTILGSSFSTLRFSSTTGTGEFRTVTNNTFESGAGGGNTATFMTDGGGRLVINGNVVNNGTGVRNTAFTRGGSGTAIVELNGAFNTTGALTTGSETLVRLNTTSIAAYGGNSDITNSTDRSTLDGTLDLNGRGFDRKIGTNNQGGVLGAGALVNSNMGTASTVSGNFSNLGTSSGNRDFGGPGTLILTGAIRLNPTGTTDTGLQKVGPGAVILRTTSLTEGTAGSNNPNDILGGTLVLDHAANNTQKVSNDVMQLQNGRLVILGNNSAATTVTTGNLQLGGAGDKGYAEIEVRSGTGAATTLALGNITASGTGATFSDQEILNFQVVDNGGGTPTITTTSADAVLPATVTFNKSQFARISGGQVVGLSPELIAADAATFQSSSGYTQNIDVTGSYTTSTATNLRTMRFNQAGSTTLTLDAVARMNKDSAGGGLGSAILVTSDAGAVTINGTQGLDIGVNTSLTIYQHSDSALTIDARIAGGSGGRLTKVGVGELVLNNVNNSFYYGGGTAVQVLEGTLTVPHMSNEGQNSPIGGGRAIVLGNKNTINYATGVATQAPARFRYTGSGHQTDRVFQLVGVGEIQANGTGLLEFTRTGSTIPVVSSVGNTGAWNDLILSGSGAGKFNGLIDLGHGNLVKKEAGTWTMGSTAQLKTYGKLQIDGGTFVQDGSLASIRTQTIVGNGATLKGSGSVYALQVQAGGTLAPGNSPGIFTSGDLQLDGTLAIQANGPTAGTEYDRLSILGSATLGPASNLQFTLGYVPSLNDSFLLLSNDGIDLIAGQFATVNNHTVTADTFTLSGYQFQLNYAGGDGNDLVATAIVVPEPSVAMLGLGVTMLALARRVRRDQSC